MGQKSVFRRLFDFFEGVKHEVLRISWPSKNDVFLSTIVVFVLAVISALFFAVVDSSVYKIVHYIIGNVK